MKHNVKINSYNRFVSSTIHLEDTQDYSTIRCALDEYKNKLEQINIHISDDPNHKEMYKSLLKAIEAMDKGLEEALR